MMRRCFWFRCVLFTSLLALVQHEVQSQELRVVSVYPRVNGLQAATDSSIRITFDRPIDPNSVTRESFRAFGRWSGDVEGAFRISDDLRDVIFTPTHPFSAGELVSVNLSSDLRAADASPLRSAGYASHFWTASRGVDTLQFDQIASMTTNSSPNTKSRPYGGVATDLNNDGWLDITVVNEDTADVRVFMNQADGTGAFKPFLTPPSPVGNRVSPSEPHDFNHDGFADLAVANINDNTVSVLLGHGDGTFAPQQLIQVGIAPRGIAVLDADGDGDIDLVNSNFGSSDLSLMLNNGEGVFGDAQSIPSDVVGEFSLMSGDMNNDGIADLIVGGQTSRDMQVLVGRGNGTFDKQPLQNSGGQSWQLMLGDVNADGNLDIATVNGRSDNGAILLGNGDGTLRAPQIYELANMGPTGGNTWLLASDLGDMDGDGDLDWVTSSYAGGRASGDWLVLKNDGQGQFTFFAELDSPSAASCGLLHDIDNDGDLDLGLIDEIADRLVIMKNTGTLQALPLLGDFDGDNQVTIVDLDRMMSELVSHGNNLQFDIDHDGGLENLDLVRWVKVAQHTWFGDADLDGEFNSSDLTLVFQTGEYEDLLITNSTWRTGDWTGDGEFTSSDLVAAFQDGGYEKGLVASVVSVPEPSALALFVLLVLGVVARRPGSQAGVN